MAKKENYRSKLSTLGLRAVKKRVIVISVIALAVLLISLLLVFQVLATTTLMAVAGSEASLSVTKRYLSTDHAPECSCGCLLAADESNLSGYGFTNDTSHRGQAFNLYMAILQYISEYGYEPGNPSTRITLHPGVLMERFDKEGAKNWFLPTDVFDSLWVTPSTGEDGGGSIFETLTLADVSIDGEGNSLKAIELVFPGNNFTKPPRLPEDYENEILANVNDTSVNILGHHVRYWTAAVSACPQEILDVFGATVPPDLGRHAEHGNPIYLPDILWGACVRLAKGYAECAEAVTNGAELTSELKSAISTEAAKPLAASIGFGCSWNMGNLNKFAGIGPHGSGAKEYNNFYAAVFEAALSGELSATAARSVMSAGSNSTDGTQERIEAIKAWNPDIGAMVEAYVRQTPDFASSNNTEIQQNVFRSYVTSPFASVYYVMAFEDFVVSELGFADYAGAAQTGEAFSSEIDITFIGDSIGVHTEPVFREKVGINSYFDVLSGRFVSEGKEALESILGTESLKSHVVLELGTNAKGESDLINLEEMIKSLSDKTVVIVTPFVFDENPGYGYVEATAEWIRGLPSRYSNASVADWNKAVRSNHEDTLFDGVHLNTSAYEIYVDLVLNAFGTSAPFPQNNSTTPLCDCVKTCSCWDVHGETANSRNLGDYGALSGPYQMRVDRGELEAVAAANGNDSADTEELFLSIFTDKDPSTVTVRISLSDKEASLYYFGYLPLPFEYADPISNPQESSAFYIRFIENLYADMHRGFDYPDALDTPIRAFADGTVVAQVTDMGTTGYGCYLVLDHGGGIRTLYAHLNGQLSGISIGSVVKKGDIIGSMGSTGLSTGPHLHFEIRQEHNGADRFLVPAYYVNGYANTSTSGSYVPPFADPSRPDGYFVVNPWQ